MMEMKDKHVAVLVEDLYEDLELWYPVMRLREAGAQVTIVGPSAKAYRSKHGYEVKADKGVDEVDASGIDLLIVPGGYSPDRMRLHKSMVDLVRKVHDQGKIVASICHGPWMLASAGIIKGKRITAWPSLRDDLVNAGAKFEDAEAVHDGNIITSRKPDDLPAFLRTILAAVSETKSKAA